MKAFSILSILVFTQLAGAATTVETINAADPNMPAVLGGATYATASTLVNSGLRTLEITNIAELEALISADLASAKDIQKLKDVKNLKNLRLLLKGSGFVGAFTAGYAIGDAIVTWDKNSNQGMLVGFTSEEIIEPLMRKLAGNGKQ